MDVLEMKENEAFERAASERRQSVEDWNKKHKVGELVCGKYEEYVSATDSWRSMKIYGKTSSLASLGKDVNDVECAIVEVEMRVMDVETISIRDVTMKIPLYHLRFVEGSSPALANDCPVCLAPMGVYCKTDYGSRQVIAHKKRRNI